MKTTKIKAVWFNKGLDLTSPAGQQETGALRRAKNVVRRAVPSLKKRPGLRRIPYAADDSGVQGPGS